MNKTVKDHGALGNGTTDDSAALASAQNAEDFLLFADGDFLISANFTFTKPCIFLPGARLLIPDQVTIRFDATLEAGTYQIFICRGTGQVIFSGQLVRQGRPEWWGAVVNSTAAAAANLAAISACVKASPITEFQAADYFISGTLELTTQLRTLQGVDRSEFASNVAGQTRIVVTNGTSHVIKIHTPGAGRPDTWNQHVTINDIQICRTGAPVCPASGNEINGPAGIFIESVIWVFLNRITCNDHYSGIILNGTIRVTMTQVLCQRFSAGIGPHAANDKFFGFWLNGYRNIGAAGGNASTYFTDCTVTGSPPGKQNESVGFYLPGAFVDTFLQRCETTQTGYGILVDAAGLTPDLQRSGCADLHIVTPIIDAFTVAGVKIINGSAYTAIDILGGYCAPAGGSSPSAGLHIEKTFGLVSITNWQTICWPAPSCRGLYVKESNGVRSVGGMYVGSARPVELDAVSRSVIEDSILNHAGGETTTQAAVLLTNRCSRNFLRPTIYGDANSFIQGVRLDGTGNNLNEINCINIDASAIKGGASNALHINGTAVVAPGVVKGVGTTNLASGLIG